MEIIATISSLENAKSGHLQDLIEEGLTGIRIVAKGRNVEETIAFVELALDLSSADIFSGPLWLDFPGLRPRIGQLPQLDDYLGQGTIVSLVDQAHHDGTSLGIEGLERLSPDLVPETRVGIADGLIQLTVTKVTSTGIYCRVDKPGHASRGRSLTIHGLDSSRFFGLTEDHIRIAESLSGRAGLEYTVSWVSTATQLRSLHSLIPPSRLIPKLETDISDTDLRELVSEIAEKLLIGRSDLYASVGDTALRSTTNRYIAAAKAASKEVYVGSRILDSLEYSSRSSAEDILDVEQLASLGVSGFLIGGSSDKESKLRKVHLLNSILHK